ncbi:dicarboxylate/amino acid:cation symporter [Brochothrix thermosphacta]|uniref:dicarboxylate/amino acid:cation symporter n=1 Tax=Brochothrix thermosphacta TaxID=2756 RepID=UPI0003E87F0A|nr:dicarboxylate/amino acid:cation symporter [Brochothrix thermosphacta]EUJ36567.1 H+/sodium:glutamate symporter [Brochothrix thermosphacta DSM 20171 = FSL F6-1036]ODJ51874.1 sodium:proton antiporter [Brochothrix thermosphacta DSM 20171 = FSL F6-1036]ODJ58831.1 sodium:proton antiporter [Brochothrix thermosphacta]SOC00357.1 Sodium:dicarboxylate symporter family protein [Brochothrix thermosphacta]SPP30021.1 putative sodium:dicarboxylate symporter family protein [Brochothrix thermosphacta]
MKNRFKQYRSSFLLLSAIILGGLIGVLFPQQTHYLKPIGDVFVNFMFMAIVPFVFFSISSAIASMDGAKRLGKIMGSTFLIFIFTAICAAIIGYIGIRFFPLVQNANLDTIKTLMSSTPVQDDISLADRLVGIFTVNDFSLLLSKEHMLPLIFFSVLIGLATSSLGTTAKPFAVFLKSGSEVLMKLVQFIMYLAPVGLGCYFAAIIGDLGSQIIGSYVRVIVLYIGIALFYFIVMNTVYALLAGGKYSLRSFWRNITQPAVTAIATCSSAASIPVNLNATKDMGVPNDIAETVIPLGANTHKDGSVIGGVFKIAFLYGVFNRDITGIDNMITIILCAFLVGAVMGAIPGGGMIAEVLIVTILGFPLEAVPLIIVISTIIDMPATLLNSSGNTVSAMMVTRLVEGRNYFKQRFSKKRI